MAGSVYTNDEDDYAKVDHMKLDMSGTTNKLFGTTRSSDFVRKGFHINVFIVSLNVDFSYNSVETF